MKFGFTTLLMVISIVLSAYYFAKIIELSNDRQEIENDKAVLGSIKFGLFSVYEWRDKITVVLNKKIDEFQINDENSGDIQQKLEQMLYFALDEVEKIMKERANEGFWGSIQSAVASFAVDINDLRSRVPGFAQDTMRQLGDEGTMTSLKDFLKRRLKDAIDKKIGKGDKKVFDDILAKYEYQPNGQVVCINHLEEVVKKFETKIWINSLILILLSGFMVALLYFKKIKEKIDYYLVLISFLILLLAGVLTPMIDLDARIKQVKFLLMGEPITFNEQMLFYQSKSIIDVFVVLLKSGQIESMVISVLVLLFSVVFPICKLFSSYVYISNDMKVNSKIIDFFVFKSGKWSMADVVVVAIFMSFIGFRGVINTQLSKLSTINPNIEVITTNETQLQAGFMTFTFFCLFSIMFSNVLAKKS